MIKKFKLKHLDLITEREVDYAKFMVDLYGYKNSRWNKVKAFAKSFNETYEFLEEMKKLDPKKVVLNPECQIKPPNNIDSITFSAMMNIQMLSENSEIKEVGELMAEMIASACFSENCKGDFNTKSIIYKHFKNRVWESPALDMIGLYNHIDELLRKSSAMWEKLFMEVAVDDPDYVQAGGGRLNNFNVINTIKTTCQDFNITYEEAWQMPYGVTQTNSLSKATATYVQDKMAKIKEQKMRFERSQK